MKKIVLINILLLLGSICSYAQYSSAVNNSNKLASFNAGNTLDQSDTTKRTKDADFYLTKSRNLQAAGYCLLGAGTIGLVIGLASFPKNTDILITDDKDRAQADRATTTTIIAAAVMCSSIPFFILSNSNKKKAKLYLNSEKVSKGIPVHTGNITGLTLDIALGR